MSTTDNSLNDPNMIQAANDFALALVQNQALLLKWFDTLAAALKDKNYEIAILNDFIANQTKNGVKDYNTTYAYVVQAQQKLPAYAIYYWSALYKTSKKPAGDTSATAVEGTPVSVVGSGSSSQATFVSLGREELIDYTFDQLVLTWDSSNQLINMVSQALFMALNIGMLHKTAVEIKELRLKIQKAEKEGQDTTEAEKQLGEAEDRQGVGERAADQQVAAADEIADPVREMDPENFQLGAEDAQPAAEPDALPEIQPPSDREDLALSEEQAQAMDEAIEEQVKAEGEELNQTEADENEGGNEGEGEDGVMEDGTNVLETEVGELI